MLFVLLFWLFKKNQINLFGLDFESFIIVCCKVNLFVLNLIGALWSSCTWKFISLFDFGKILSLYCYLIVFQVFAFCLHVNASDSRLFLWHGPRIPSVFLTSFYYLFSFDHFQITCLWFQFCFINYAVNVLRCVFHFVHCGFSLQDFRTLEGLFFFFNYWRDFFPIQYTLITIFLLLTPPTSSPPPVTSRSTPFFSLVRKQTGIYKLIIQ